MITQKELLLKFERNLRKCADENGKISIGDLEREVTCCLGLLEAEEREDIPVKKLIFVEDGSVDTDELEETLDLRNPEIKVVVYRQGARSPELVEVK